MSQTDSGNYKTKESVAQMFYHSCLGKAIIALGIFIVLLVIAHMTVPSEEKMRAEMIDDIYECIEANDSIHGDKIDDAVNNLFFIFTTADSTNINQEVLDLFRKYNKLEIYPHAFYSTAHIHNNFRPEGTRVGIGIFGIVIPTVNFNDFLLRVGPVRGKYNERLIKNTYGDDGYMGTTPDLGNTYNTYEGGGSSNEPYE